jgi:AraC-like DNA-binding protein
VLDDVRYAMSRQLLASSATSVAGIAAALGYAESSAFIRAFTRWSGTTPERWRRRNRRTSAPAVRRTP